MKKSTAHRKKKIIRYRPARKYPNAADSRYYLDRLTDMILTAATVCGTVTILAFLFVIS